MPPAAILPSAYRRQQHNSSPEVVRGRVAQASLSSLAFMRNWAPHSCCESRFWVFGSQQGWDSIQHPSHAFGRRDKCQGPTSVGPLKQLKQYFLAPQARAQRSGARSKKVDVRFTFFVSRNAHILYSRMANTLETEKGRSSPPSFGSSSPRLRGEKGSYRFLHPT